MTESEIIKTLSEALPEGYRIEERGRRIHVLEDHAFWIGWPSSSVFLFGSIDQYPSFFRWLGVWAAVAVPGDHHTYGAGCRKILATCPWLLGLRDCSSVEEMELKLAVSGGLA